MHSLEKATRLKAMLSQIAPSEGLESISRLPGLRASREGLESLGHAPEAVDSGLLKMAQNREHELTPGELYGLEAIVMPTGRPVVFIRENSYDDLDAPWTALNDAAVRDRINPLLPLIGRVEVPNSPVLPYAGTGFVVGNNLLMTNRHVAALFSQGLGLKILYRAGDAAVDFKRQVDAPDDQGSAYLMVQSVEMIHPYWDMALLKVTGLPSNALKLSIKSPEELVGRDIVAVGYPARDDRNDLALQDKIFQRTYNVKRLQPGTIRQRATMRSFEHSVNALTHDSSTLGGNSGSAIIDVQSGDVVALHFAGQYLLANYAVPMYELARDPRVAPKLNFGGTLTPTRDFDLAWQRVSGEADGTPSFPAAPTRSDAHSVALQSPTPAPPSGAVSGISFGQPSIISDRAVARGSAVAPAKTPEEEAVVVDQNYADRPGYDPNFLDDVEVPLPGLTKQMQEDTAVVGSQFRKGDDAFELAYYHYSVYMNKRRRTAWFSAANVDGSHRPDIGKRQGDRWFLDPRISREEQMGQEAYEHGIDRGHLTRREDTAWGTTVASALKANNDTFHFTNCSLQASLFNRGKDRWQGLEQFLLEKHAKKDKRKMIVITGPVFAVNDPVYRNDNMDYSVRCPIQFWKVCVLVREADGKPSATAFVLGQEDITDLPGFEETFDVVATQIKIADLEKRTGLDYGLLKNHDHFAQTPDPGTLELPGAGLQGQRAKVIRTGSDIVA